MTEQRRLYKAKNNRILFGVCGGIGDYFGVDPNVIRIGTVLLACTGTGLVAYIAAAILLPEKP
ncbi:PspC domain-containing protein [Ruminococcus sp. FC2018]|uniref:PspC domain-containing protein n=1 Tax=Ruminococcus sp. FC2018 TaxID=1410617 RepID=UPI0004902C4A|nr:PspC domain-containing protein [Ruminococcus sp. FC2018]